MGNEQQSRMDTIQQAVETMRHSNLLNDTFVSIALEDVKACQYVLRKILGCDDLEVIEAKGQYRLLNLTSKDSILDVLAEDGRGRLMNIEIQRGDTVDHARRSRYYGSMLDKSSLEKGLPYDQLPDVYIIYISETDIWNTGEAVSPVEKTLGKAAIPYDDGSHVFFVNAAVDDGSEVAQMMKYFKTADPDDMSQGELSKRVRYLKREKGGRETMSEISKWLIDKGMEWGIEQGIEKGIEQGMEKGIEQGIKQGMEKGIEQGMQKGMEQGIEQGELNKTKTFAVKMYQNGFRPDYIAEILDTSVIQVEEWLGLTLA